MPTLDEMIEATRENIADIEAMIVDAEAQNMVKSLKAQRIADLTAFLKTLEGYLKTLKEAKK